MKLLGDCLNSTNCFEMAIIIVIDGIMMGTKLEAFRLVLHRTSLS